MTAGSARSLLSSTRRSLLSSQKGFPISLMTPESDFTSRANASCVCFVCSWCLESVFFVLVSAVAWNSAITLAISGPDTIQRRNAAGFSVRPTAPPSPFTDALFCSCAWSMAKAENACVVFFTVKFPAMNSANTSGCLSSSATMSRK